MKKKNFVEFEMYVYNAEEFQQYMQQKNAAIDPEISKIDNLSSESLGYSKDKIDMPSYSKSVICFDPNELVSFSETYSLIESINNPEDPQMDCIEVSLKGDLDFAVIATLGEFKEKLSDYIAFK